MKGLALPPRQAITARVGLGRRATLQPISLGLHRQLFTTRPNPLAQPSAPPQPAPPPTQPDNITTPPSIDTTTPLLSPHTSPKISSTRLQAYAPRLTAISRRTGVPFASLAGSFLVLHEITAIVPVVILFFIFQALGAGAGIVAWLTSLEEGVEGTVKEMWEEGGAGGQAVKKSRGWRGWVKDWMAEAEEKAERVGKRYGILGYEKVVKPKKGEVAGSAAAGTAGASGGEAVAGAVTAGGAAEKVANAIAAYVVVKAILPLRIGLSLALAPSFARFALYPIRRLMGRIKSKPKPPIKGDAS